jgi:sigma-B regulation protein RsbU (phosphoserine phosphatase)
MSSMDEEAAEKSADFHRVNKQLEQAYQQISQEIELARRIQQSLLPQTLPQTPAVRFAVHYRPSGRIGGDFYDVFRLDEDHVGFYVADVMGHGVPASLLTIFLKKAVRAKEIFGNQYRLLPPDEVLQQLNRDLVDLALADIPFITMIYGLFNSRARTLIFARAGHPHPLYIPREGAPEMWQVHGTLLGVFETQFTVQTRELQPGDKVLFYTDGLDAVGDAAQSDGARRLLAQALLHRALPVQECVARIALHLFEGTSQPDDFTLLAMEVTA